MGISEDLIVKPSSKRNRLSTVVFFRKILIVKKNKFKPNRVIELIYFFRYMCLFRIAVITR